MSNKVAVYGSLKNGMGNHSFFLTDATCLGKTKTEGEFSFYNLGAFPAVVPGGDTEVHVEVYEVNDEEFSRLDRLEGYPSFYDRMEIETEFGTAWMYFLPSVDGYGKLQEITSGVW